MKVKFKFVTNSSSASYTIPKDILTPEQLFSIKFHSELMHLVMKDEDYYSDPWEVIENEDSIDVSTSMDNFDMTTYLEKIGVDLDKCKFWHS